MRPTWTAASVAVFALALSALPAAPAVAGHPPANAGAPLANAAAPLANAGAPLAKAGATRANAVAAPSEQDKNYLITAHQFNLARIDSGQLARLKGVAPAVRDLASKIVTDHLSLDEALIPVANQLGVTLPAQPDDEQKAAQSELEAMASGADFDREWVNLEQSTHTTAINEGQAETTGGTDPAVIRLAQDAAAVLGVHHGELMRLSTNASPPSHVDSGSGGLADPRRTLIPLAITGIGLLLILGGVTLRRRSVQ